MARTRLRLVLALSVFVALFAVLAAPAIHPAGAQQSGNGAGVLIGQTGVIGAYSLPEPPAFPPVLCAFDAAGANVSIGPPDVVSVFAKPQYAIQKVDVENRLYQKSANGTFSLVRTMAGGSILAVNHEFTPVPGTATAFNVPSGSDYVYAYNIIFYAPDFSKVEGTVTVAYATYRSTVAGSSQTFPDSTVCGRIAQPQPTPTPTKSPSPVQTSTPAPAPTKTPTPVATRTPTPVATTTPTPVVKPTVEVSAVTGTVNSLLRYTISGFPSNVSVPITFEGVKIASAMTGASGTGTGSFRIPAAQIGQHTIRWDAGNAHASVVYTVKPRIKISPNANVMRGQTVTVSLTGFGKNEVVRIRWKKGTSWVQIAQVTTNTTGSANINVKVPGFVPDGPTSVRGDGTVGRAQTNAVTVSGGPFVPAAAKSPAPSPSPTATKAATITPSPPATVTITQTATPIVETPTPEESTKP